MKLGKGTKWCTAHEEPKWYNHYTEEGHKLYIIRDKKTGDRWQYSDKTDDFLNQEDKGFNIFELMRQDKKLSKFFEKLLGVDYYAFDGTFIYTGQPVPSDIVNRVENVVISNNVTSIDRSAFDHCTNLTSITIPNSVTSIGNYAFFKCSSLTSITIPNSVTSIGDCAFAYCTSLTSIIIPNSVTSIGCWALDDCPNLTIYTDNDYVVDYCEKYKIPVKSLKAKNESYNKRNRLKLQIRE
jgi:hypothetical protein